MTQNKAEMASIKVISVTPEYLKAFWIAARNCYYKGKLEELEGEYSTDKAELLLKKIIRFKHDSCLEHISFQISMENVSRSFMAQITRHRHVTFHISSQHYQNHSDFLYVEPRFSNPKNKILFENLMETINETYKTIIKNGDMHYIAREVLPNATACKIIMTVNLRELRHIITIRQGIDNTPEMQEIIKYLRIAVAEVNPMFLWGLA